MEFEGDSSSRESWESCEDNKPGPQISAAKCLFIGSEHFNPILALGCNDLTIPISGASRYHSIAEFEECVPSLEEEGTPPPLFPVSRKPRKVLSKLHVPPVRISLVSKLPESEKLVPPVPGSCISTQASQSATTATETTEDNKSKPTDEPLYPIPGRRFLAHQLPVAQIQKEKLNVLTLMNDSTGPLRALNEARLKFQRVRVWRRGEFGIRGYCSGFVVCFDKHWNLILKDVDEIFQRRRSARVVGKQKTTGSDNEEQARFKSGQFLSEYSRRTARGKGLYEGHVTHPVQVQDSPHTPSSVIRKGTPTGYLINGPEDATEVCRIGIRRLMLNATEKEKLKTVHVKKLPEPDDDGAEGPHVTKSTLRKKQLVILRKAETDFLGNKIMARTQLYEIVERHLAQIVLMGRSVAFVETNLQFQI